MGASQGCYFIGEPFPPLPRRQKPKAVAAPDELVLAESFDSLVLSVESLTQRVQMLELELQNRPLLEELDAKVGEMWEKFQRGVECEPDPSDSCELSNVRQHSKGQHKEPDESEPPSDPCALPIVHRHSKGRRKTEKDTPQPVQVENNVQMSERDRMEHEIIRRRELKRDEVQESIRKQLRLFKQMGLSDNDGNKATDLTEDQRNTLDEDCLMKEYAKDEICSCETTREIIMKAELLIEEDWLDKIDALPGNMFCLCAFGGVIPGGIPPDGARICSLTNLKACSKYMGCLLITLIQLIGPPLIFFSRMPGSMGIPDMYAYEWRCHPLFAGHSTNNTDACPSGKLPEEVYMGGDWDEMWTTKFLGIVFSLCFILNGLFVILQEMNTWKNLYNTFRFLDWKNDKFKAPGSFIMVAGAFVNCWVVVWSCLDMYVVVGASRSPQDLLLDALGLLFLFRLDDVESDLGFLVKDDWPGLRIAWIYNELVRDWDDDEFDEEKLDVLGAVCLFFYKFVICLICAQLLCIPILAGFTPFIDIVPES